MEIAAIKGDEVLLIYHPIEASAEVGKQFKILELPDKTEGLVIQIISNDSLEYIGIQQEIIQRVLEERLATVFERLNRETGMGEMRNLKLATAKIRKHISSNTWLPWGGWIPTRNVVIESIGADELVENTLPYPDFPITLCSFNGALIDLNGPQLNMVNVVTGMKGTGKSHLAKHLVLSLAEHRVPVIIFDINGEYVNLPGVQVFRWSDNLRPSLTEIGYQIVEQVIRDIYPLNETSAAVFSNRLPQLWASRKEYCRTHNQEFTFDIPLLYQSNWGNQQLVTDAIQRRLEMVGSMKLFHDYRNGEPEVSLGEAYNLAVGNEQEVGRPIVFDMRSLSAPLKRALVRAINDILKDTAAEEAQADRGKGRFPFVVYEEAHFYISDEVILDIITLGRHIGMGAIFVTNTPQELPRTVFRQLDNLFLLGLTHSDDIRNVSQSSFTDEDTIRSFATRMPKHHALIIGNVTSRYPLIVKVEPLPEGVPASGQTRSTWDRFIDG